MSVVEPSRRHAPPPSAAVTETETEYLVELDVSDFAPEELLVELEGDEVTIVGEQRPSPEGVVEPFRLHERLEESFRLPPDADAEWLSALYAHGTLELRAPRLGTCPGGKRRIDIVERNRTRPNPDATPC